MHATLTWQQHSFVASTCVIPVMFCDALPACNTSGLVHVTFLAGMLPPWMLPQVAPEGYLHAAMLKKPPVAVFGHWLLESSQSVAFVPVPGGQLCAQQDAHDATRHVVRWSAHGAPRQDSHVIAAVLVARTRHIFSVPHVHAKRMQLLLIQMTVKLFKQHMLAYHACDETLKSGTAHKRITTARLILLPAQSPCKCAVSGCTSSRLMSHSGCRCRTRP